MKKFELFIVFLLVFLVVGCNKDKPVEPTTTTLKKEESKTRANVDFGGVEKVSVTAKGYGKTISQAVDDALKNAIEQINGKRINSSTDSVSATYNLSIGTDSVEVNESALVQMISSKTNGAVTGFKIIRQQKTTRPVQTSNVNYSYSDAGSSSSSSSSGEAAVEVTGGSASASSNVNTKSSNGAVKETYSSSSTRTETVWEVEITAEVAKYRESADAKRPRIVIAMPRSAQSEFIVGGSSFSSEELGRLVKNRLSDSIAQTNRFTVLDREFTDEISKEMEFIESGMVKNEDYARVGQMLATDLIVIPKLDRFEYLKSSRKMKMIDRTIVSYSGGGTISIQIINAVTGQVVLSESYSAELPSTAPTTMSNGIDGGKLTNMLMDSITSELISNMLAKTFPVAVISMNGLDVVLNQGGQAVKQSARYNAVQLGQEVIDPQTGQSLGMMDSPCCTIEITRIGPNMSYGRIVDEGFIFAGKFKPGIIELREQVKSLNRAEPSSSKEKTSSAHNKAASNTKKQQAHKDPTEPSAEDDW